MAAEKKSFTDIFNINPSGSISPAVKINVNGVIFGPGVTFSGGVSFGGINFHQYMGQDISVDIQGDLYIIKGFYK